MPTDVSSVTIVQYLAIRYNLLSPSEGGLGFQVGITMRDIGEHSGVSTATVSRVLNGEKGVRADTRDRVYAAIRELGYTANGVARSLRLQRTMAVGIIVGDMANPVLAHITQAATERLGSDGYFVMMVQRGKNTGDDGKLFALLRERSIDGLIWSIAAEDDRKVLKVLIRPEVPTVLVDRYVPGTVVDAVVADHKSSVQTEMRTLIRMGHRAIGILPGPLNQWPGRERYDGYLKVLSEEGLVVNPAWVYVAGQAIDEGYVGSRRLLAANPPPTAIIVGGTRNSVGALRAVRDLGLRLPRDISFVALSPPELGDIWTPPITSVTLPLQEMGKSAAELLLDRMRGVEMSGPRCLKIPTKIVLGGSVGPPVLR